MIPVITKEQLVISDNILGKSAFGTVSAGTYLGTKVAIKHVCLKGMRKLAKTVAKKEASIHATVRHPNIVQLIGVVVEPQDLYIVTELISGHSLDELLFIDEHRTEFSREMKLNITNQLLQGMAYLHGSTIPIGKNKYSEVGDNR